MTFGAGLHFCPGVPLARPELAASFSFGALLRAAPGLRLVREPGWQPGFVIRGLTELLVEVQAGATTPVSANDRRGHGS